MGTVKEWVQIALSKAAAGLMMFCVPYDAQRSIVKDTWVDPPALTLGAH